MSPNLVAPGVLNLGALPSSVAFGALAGLLLAWVLGWTVYTVVTSYRGRAVRCSCLPQYGYVCAADRHAGEFG